MIRIWRFRGCRAPAALPPTPRRRRPWSEVGGGGRFGRPSPSEPELISHIDRIMRMRQSCQQLPLPRIEILDTHFAYSVAMFCLLCVLYRSVSIIFELRICVHVSFSPGIPTILMKWYSRPRPKRSDTITYHEAF